MSKYECPRCGSGIKPNDLQCDRCGEMLKKVDPRKPREDDMPSAIVIDKVYSEEQTHIRLDSTDYTSMTKLRKMLEEKDKELLVREKAILEKEKRMQDTFDKMEKDQNQLEESLRQFESDQVMVRCKEMSIKEREQEIDELSSRFEKGIEEVLELEGRLKGSRMTAADVKKLDDVKRKYGQAEHDKHKPEHEKGSNEASANEALKVELSIAKEQLERADGRIAELERSVSTGPPPITVGDRIREEEEKARAITSARVSDLLKVIKPELDAQLGKGLTVPVREMSIHTHIEKFDTILGGGIPEGHILLVNGAPGTMKSTLTYTILHNAALFDGVDSMYFSLEQSRESILKQMARFKMPEELAAKHLMVVDMVDLRKGMGDVKGDWREILLRYVKNVFAERPFKVFVLDSLDSFKALAEHDFTRQDLKDLFDWFKSIGITVLLISERPMVALLESVQSELYLSDGAIELQMKEIDDSKVQRWVRCPKMRGMNIDTRYYMIFHDGDKFNLTSPIVGQ